MGIEFLSALEVSEVLVIHPNFERFRSTKEVGTPFLETGDNSQKFLVINFIMSLCVGKGSTHKCDGMPFLVIVLLREDSSNCIITSIAFDMPSAFLFGKRER